LTVEQTNRINALLKRCYRYGYIDKIHCLSDLLNSVDLALCDKMQSKAHCLYPLLPPEVNFNIYAVGGMTLFYPHVPKIFTRDLSSCVVCLILCTVIIPYYCIVSLFYRTVGLSVWNIAASFYDWAESECVCWSVVVNMIDGTDSRFYYIRLALIVGLLPSAGFKVLNAK